MIYRDVVTGQPVDSDDWLDLAFDGSAAHRDRGKHLTEKEGADLYSSSDFYGPDLMWALVDDGGESEPRWVPIEEAAA